MVFKFNLHVFLSGQKTSFPQQLTECQSFSQSLCRKSHTCTSFDECFLYKDYFSTEGGRIQLNSNTYSELEVQHFLHTWWAFSKTITHHRLIKTPTSFNGKVGGLWQDDLFKLNGLVDIQANLVCLFVFLIMISSSSKCLNWTFEPEL